jgi:hypothetical protein
MEIVAVKPDQRLARLQTLGAACRPLSLGKQLTQIAEMGDKARARQALDAAGDA